MYKPPDYCCHSLVEHLHASLAKLPTESETILGDFNADFSAKKNVSAYKLKHELQRLASLNDFDQLIKSPTRICNQSRSIIDFMSFLRLLVTILLFTAQLNLVSLKSLCSQWNIALIVHLKRILLSVT